MCLIEVKGHGLVIYIAAWREHEIRYANRIYKMLHTVEHRTFLGMLQLTVECYLLCDGATSHPANQPHCCPQTRVE